MSKELEALQELRQNNIDDTHLFDDELLDIIEKSLKALEIISRKGVNTLDVMESENYSDYIKIEKQYYYDHYIEGRMPDFDDWFETWVLTKTEYDLLKEVLL